MRDIVKCLDLVFDIVINYLASQNNLQKLELNNNKEL